MISFCKRQASKCQTFAPLTALGNTSARHVALAPSMCLSCKDAFECISHTEWSKRRVCLWPTSFSPIQQTEDLNSVVTHINGRKHREKSRLATQSCQNSCLFASACLVAWELERKWTNALSRLQGPWLALTMYKIWSAKQCRNMYKTINH